MNEWMNPKARQKWLPYLVFCMTPFSYHILTVEWRTAFPLMLLLIFDTLVPKMHCIKDKFYTFLCHIFAIITWDLQLLFWFLDSPYSSFKNQISSAPNILLLFFLLIDTTIVRQKFSFMSLLIYFILLFFINFDFYKFCLHIYFLNMSCCHQSNSNY
jgi:hypothetical protein